MHDMETRLNRLAKAVRLRRMGRDKRQIGTLSVAVWMLGMAELGLLVCFGKGTVGQGQYLFGASMLSKDVGGYVLVGVLAFVVAVIFTLICIHCHKK